MKVCATALDLTEVKVNFIASSAIGGHTQKEGKNTVKRIHD